MPTSATGYAVVVADGHFDGDPAALQQFLAFLQMLSASPDAQALYILGDLFTLWLGAPGLQLPHQAAVVQAFQELTDQGKDVVYVEGNRDYFLRPQYAAGRPFTDIATEGLDARVGDQRVYFAHGDLVNGQDTQYRRWRRFSRNRVLYALFTALPRCVALRLAQTLERSFRGTNQRHKADFPADTCRHFAHTRFPHADIVVLGHFHHQYHYAAEYQGRTKALYVLPAWKDCPIYLRIPHHGPCEFIRFSQAA